jgi:hypothetical protein
MMRRSGAWLASLAALCGSASAPVLADDEAGGRQLEARRAIELSVDSAITTSPNGPSVSTLGGALSVGGAYRLENGLAVSIAGGITALSLAVEGQSTRAGTLPGNVLLGVSLEPWRARQIDAALSLELGAPLALYPGGIDDNRLAELAYTMAASAQGFREPFLWQTNVVPIILGVHATARAFDWLTLSGQLAPAYLVSVNQRPSRAAIMSRLDASATLRSLVARVGLTHFASALALENRHLDQLAAHLGAGAILDGQRWMLDVSLGIDAPYGAFEDAPHPWWGIGLVGDVQFGGQR